jgi:C4-type Zn-finger protein
MKEESKRWVEAGIVLASNKEAKALCPVCQSAYLTVLDTKYGDCLEWHMSCEKCGAYNALLKHVSR